MKSRGRGLAAALAAAVACVCSPAGAAFAADAPAAVPSPAWEPHPAAQGSPACQADLRAITAAIRKLDTTALMAAKGGLTLLTYGDVTEPNQVFSVRKSILAMLYGRHVAAGTIDLNATLAELGIDDVGGLLPSERQARVEDLLESRSGVYHPAANGGDDLAHAPPRGSQPPGSYFLYNNWDFNAAGTVFERRTGQAIHDAFQADIAGPIGLEDFDRARHRKAGDASRSEHLAYPFRLSTRDMARIGLLMLHEGRWAGRQVIDADWARAIVAPRTPAAQMHPPSVARRGLGYGRMWWRIEAEPSPALQGAYLAWGVHGQFILVAPGADLVVAHQRRVPEGGRRDVSWVHLTPFLRVADMLANARCHNTFEKAVP